MKRRGQVRLLLLYLFVLCASGYMINLVNPCPIVREYFRDFYLRPAYVCKNIFHYYRNISRLVLSPQFLNLRIEFRNSIHTRSTESQVCVSVSFMDSRVHPIITHYLI